MATTSDILTQVLESARKELEYVEHRLQTPAVVRYTVVRHSDVGGTSVCRIIEHGADFTKYNFAGDGSCHANLDKSAADRLLAMVLEGRSDFDKETATYEIVTVRSWLETRADTLRNMIEATQGLA